MLVAAVRLIASENPFETKKDRWQVLYKCPELERIRACPPIPESFFGHLWQPKSADKLPEFLLRQAKMTFCSYSYLSFWGIPYVSMKY